ncbi:MAG: cation transporter [bacterium]
MKRNVFFIFILIVTVLAFISCAKEEAKQEAVGADTTPTALVTFDVQGMTCAGCETSVKLALRDIEGVKNVEASYEAAEAKITVNPEKANEQEIIDAINNIGYTAKKKDETNL